MADISPHRKGSNSQEQSTLHAEILKNDLLLHEAVIKNDAEEVKKILKEPCDVNSRNNYGRAPIHWAACRGNTDLIQMLIDAKCDIEARDKFGMRPLLMAAWHGHLEAVKQLIDAGACVKSVNKQQHTLLMCAAGNRRARAEVVEHVIDVLGLTDQENKNAEDPTKKTKEDPKNNQIEEADETLDSATSPLTPTKQVNSIDPSPRKKDKRRQSQCESVLSHSSCTPNHCENQVINLSNRRSSQIAAHLQNDALSSRRSSQVTPSHIVVSSNSFGDQIIASRRSSQANAANLLSANCSDYIIASVSRRGSQITPNHIAGMVCNLDHVDARDLTGKSALHHAALAGHAKVVTMLVQAGADINAVDNDSRTPLHVACSQGQQEAAEVALARGARPHEHDRAGDTPLHAAVQAQHRDLVRLLIDTGSDPDAQNEKGLAPLHLASGLGCRGIIDCLLQAGASLNKQATNGNTPLHIACQTNNIDIIELFIAKGADLNCLNARMESAMHIAAARGDAAACRALLAAGASYRSHVGGGGAQQGGANGGGGSPLLLAARGSFTAIVDMIIKTARLDSPHEDEENIPEKTENQESSETNLTRRKCHSSQEEVNQTDGVQDQMKEILWRLAYRQLINGEWKKLAYHWSFTEEQISAIEHQYTGPSSFKEHGYRMLLIWQHSLPSDANPMVELAEGLKAIGKKSTADALKKIHNSSARKPKNRCNCVNCSIT